MQEVWNKLFKSLGQLPNTIDRSNLLQKESSLYQKLHSKLSTELTWHI